MSTVPIETISDPQTTMRVRKRSGSFEPVDVNKIVRAVSRSCVGLTDVDSLRIATKTISGLYDGATTRELDQLSIQTAAGLIVDEPQYAKLAARLLATYVDKEVRGQEIHAFSQAVASSRRLGLVNDRLADFVAHNARKLNDALIPERDREFEYFGLRTLYDRYLLKHPQSRLVLETAQQFFLRVACALSESVGEALELYQLFSALEYLPSSPTMFNAGTRHEQLSSCFLLDSPADHLEAIYDRYTDVALLSKFSGGIGLAYHRVRSRGSLIEGTNGKSNGIVPWLKTLDASVAAVNQGGKRKGACCVYLEPWHADIEEFLALRDNTGDEASRTHNLNLANWIPDLFMRRVEADGDWSLFDPKVVPTLPDLFGEAFEQAYTAAEQGGLAAKTIKARELYARMMRTLAQTGNGWMTFKDRSNRACNQTADSGAPGRTVHLSNLCTEILEVTSDDETAVCNLGSINLGRHTAVVRREGDLRLREAGAHRADGGPAARSGHRPQLLPDRHHRVVEPPLAARGAGGDGVGGCLLPDAAAVRCRGIAGAVEEDRGGDLLSGARHLRRPGGRARAAPGVRRDPRGARRAAVRGLGRDPRGRGSWAALRARIVEHGLRNSLLVAIAPTATIASIAGCTECIEPQISNLFKRETLSGDFLQVNRYLVAELKALGIWTEAMRARLKLAEGSIQRESELPEELRAIYRTAWEIPMRSLIDMAADRGAFIDQSQSLNLFVESPNIGQLSSMYFHAWKRGLKTTYYLRSRPATRIAKATVETAPAARDAEAISCSLENPESCEACQ